MSTHKIEVVRIGEVLPHPQADALELTHVFGWQCVVKKGAYQPGSLAVFIPPDYCVPMARPEFAFLLPRAKADGSARISACKLRGLVSFGLLIPAPAGAQVGDDLMESFGIVRYEPKEKISMGGDEISPPKAYAVKFDVENAERFLRCFTPGEEVVATEKIHGTNARYTFEEDRLFCGSRSQWYAASSGSAWAKAAAHCPGIEAWCRAHPGLVLYGEVYGPVQGLNYGSPGQLLFSAFAILLPDGRWMDCDPMRATLEAAGVPVAPVVYRGPFDFEKLRLVAERDSAVSTKKQLSEGVVVVPVKERHDPEIGRVCLKIVSSRYLMEG